MDLKENSLTALKYNFSIVALIFVLVIILSVNGMLIYKVIDIGNKIFTVDFSDIYKKITTYELPITEHYTKPEGNTNSFISNAAQTILGFFGCDNNRPISFLTAEHPIFLSYKSMEKFNKDNSGLDYIIDQEQKSSNIDKIKIQDSNDNSKIQEGVTSGIRIVVDKSRMSESISYELDKPFKYNFNNIEIINETGYDIKSIVHNISDNPYPFSFNKDTSGIIIYHTHTTESFVSEKKEIYDMDVYTRSRDPKLNISSVGDSLADILINKYNLNVIHNTNVHDYPDYNRSYSNAYKTISSLVKSNKNTKLVVDVHRNAGNGGTKLRLPYETEQGTVAKISFVVATGEIGLPHSKWKQNLQLALRLTDILESMYPGITEPIYISKYRYNQHVSNGAMLVEIGAEGNLLQECLKTSKILAHAINILIENQ